MGYLAGCSIRLLFFKDGIQRVLLFLLEAIRRHGVCRILKGEILAEISPVLVEHPLSLRFPALVRRFWIVETAVEAAAQICFTVRAGLASARLFYDQDLFIAGVTYVHNATIHSQGMQFNGCRAAWLSAAPVLPQ